MIAYTRQFTNRRFHEKSGPVLVRPRSFVMTTKAIPAIGNGKCRRECEARIEATAAQLPET